MKGILFLTLIYSKNVIYVYASIHNATIDTNDIYITLIKNYTHTIISDKNMILLYLHTCIKIDRFDYKSSPYSAITKSATALNSSSVGST